MGMALHRTGKLFRAVSLVGFLLMQPQSFHTDNMRLFSESYGTYANVHVILVFWLSFSTRYHAFMYKKVIICSTLSEYACVHPLSETLFYN